jgi:hypothetical protein
MKDPFSTFNNASLTVERTETEDTFRGREETGSSTIMSSRCDAQESGKAVARARDLYDAGDVVVFPGDKVTPVEPGDRATIDTDDGRTIEGKVEEVSLMSNSLVVSL